MILNIGVQLRKSREQLLIQSKSKLKRSNRERSILEVLALDGQKVLFVDLEDLTDT